MISLAVVSGLGTFMLLCLVWSLILGAVRAYGGQLGGLTGMQPYRTLVQVPGWFIAAYFAAAAFHAVAV